MQLIEIIHDAVHSWRKPTNRLYPRGRRQNRADGIAEIKYICYTRGESE